MKGVTSDFIRNYIGQGEFGLEKESLRVDAQGHLSYTPHPFGERADITRDFCENQTEMITDVYETATEVVDHLARLHREVGETILKLSTGKEYLWPFSNPPRLWENEEIPVAQFEGEQREKTVYRNYLASKYGKRKMLFSGIHLNYSLPDPMLREEYKITTKQEDAVQVEESGYRIYKDQVYLQLAQQLTKYTWFIVYLTAASPVLDFSFCTYKDSGNDWVKEDLHKYASVRCGEKGYWNDFTPILEYADLESYIQSIEHYVESGQLKGASELYYPIRL